jgi:hypothetical protein
MMNQSQNTSPKNKSQKHSSHKRVEQAAYDHPTSPWTAMYQNALSMMDAPQRNEAAQRASDPADFMSEMYQPTHDALSDIYNREV